MSDNVLGFVLENLQGKLSFIKRGIKMNPLLKYIDYIDYINILLIFIIILIFFIEIIHIYISNSQIKKINISVFQLFTLRIEMFKKKK